MLTGSGFAPPVSTDIPTLDEMYGRCSSSPLRIPTPDPPNQRNDRSPFQHFQHSKKNRREKSASGGPGPSLPFLLPLVLRVGRAAGFEAAQLAAELEHARGCGIKCGYRCSSVKLFNDINCGLRMRSATWPFSSRRSVFGQSTHARAPTRRSRASTSPALERISAEPSKG